MNSINQNQPEPNRADLHGPAAVAKIKELVGQAQAGFFCTNGGSAVAARPMNVRQVDDRGHLWFLAASDGRLVEQLLRDPAVHLFFQSSPHSGFLHLSGTARVSADKAKIAELWEPVLRTWFTGGMDDPRIRVIEVAPADGYYWDNKHGDTVAGLKMWVGAAIGKTLDDSVEGTLDV